MTRNTFMALSAHEMTRAIAGCMPAGEPDWRERLAQSLEVVAETDDLALLRAGSEMDTLEGGIRAYLANLPGIEQDCAMPGAHYDAALALARIDRDQRKTVLLAFAAELRKR